MHLSMQVLDCRLHWGKKVNKYSQQLQGVNAIDKALVPIKLDPSMAC